MTLRIGDKQFAVADIAVRSGGRLLLGVCAARFAEIDGYSTFVLLLTVEVIALALANALLAMPLLTLAPGLQGPQRRALERHSISLLRRCGLRIGVTGTLLAVGAGAWWGQNTVLLLTFLLAVLMTVDAAVLRAIRQGRFQSRHAFFADAIAAVLPLVVLLVVRPHPAKAQTWLWLSVAIGQWLAVRVLWTSDLQGSPELDLGTRARFRALGVPMAIGSAVNSASTRLHPFLIGIFGGPAAVALFGAASSLVGPLRVVATASAAILRPRLSVRRARGDHTGSVRILRLACLAQCTVGVLAIGAAVGMSEWVVVAMFGGDFAPVGGLIPIAILYASLEGIGSNVTIALQCADDRGARQATQGRVLAGFVSLGFMPVLFPVFGVHGSWWALVLGEVAFLVWIGARLRSSNQRNCARSIPNALSLR